MTQTVRKIMNVRKHWNSNVIMGQLGLTLDYLQNFGGRILDVGCGESAVFVEYLRSFDIEAEGVDLHLNKGEGYLMQSFVDRIGAIPRPDYHYQLILANSVPGIYLNNRSMQTRHTLRDEDVEEVRKTSQGALQEVLRLLDPTQGRFLACPGLSDVDESLERMIYEQGFTHNMEITSAVPDPLSRASLLLDYGTRRLLGKPGQIEDISQLHFYRSVIIPTSYQ